MLKRVISWPKRLWIVSNSFIWISTAQLRHFEFSINTHAQALSPFRIVRFIFLESAREYIEPILSVRAEPLHYWACLAHEYHMPMRPACFIALCLASPRDEPVVIIIWGDSSLSQIIKAMNREWRTPSRNNTDFRRRLVATVSHWFATGRPWRTSLK